MEIKKFFDRPIAYHRAFVEFGGVTGAVMLSQAIYWSMRTTDKDLWFYKTSKDWEEETGLTRREQDTAKKRLVKNDVLEIKKAGMPAKLYFRVKADKIEKLLFAVCAKAPNKFGGKRQTRLAESAKHIYITESTPEITTEKKKDFSFKKNEGTKKPFYSKTGERITISGNKKYIVRGGIWHDFADSEKTVIWK